MSLCVVSVKDEKLFLEGLIKFLCTEFGLTRSLVVKKFRELAIEDLDDLIEEVEGE